MALSKEHRAKVLAKCIGRIKGRLGDIEEDLGLVVLMADDRLYEEDVTEAEVLRILADYEEEEEEEEEETDAKADD